MFRFGLEKVLRHKERLVEKQARRLRVVEEHLRRLAAQRSALEDEARERARGGVTATGRGWLRQRYTAVPGAGGSWDR